MELSWIGFPFSLAIKFVNVSPKIPRAKALVRFSRFGQRFLIDQLRVTLDEQPDRPFYEQFFSDH
jgi:hypothetical protein